MRNKKSIFSIVLLIVLSLVVVGCNKDSKKSDDQSGEGPIVINFGHGGSEETAQQVGALKLKEYIEENSDGRIKVNVYPNNQIGNDRELAESVQGGSLEMCLANSVQVNFVPDSIVYDLYFNFKDIDSAINKFRNDEDFYNVMSKKYEDVGYHLGGFSVHGFREITSNKPIKTPDDFEGLTFRTQENTYHILGFKCLGANPTPFAFNELYTALQQGTVDAQENPIELIYSQKFYEQQKYITLTNHQQQVQTWLMNLEFYNNLPDDLKKVVDEGIKSGCDAAQEYALSMEDEWKKVISDHGVTFIELTDDEYNAFKEKVKPQWDEIEKKVDKDVWEAYIK